MSGRLNRSRLLQLSALVVLAALAAGLVTLALGASSRQPVAAQMATLTPVPTTPLTVFVGDSSAAGAGASRNSERWTTLAAGTLGWQEKNLAHDGTAYGPLDARGGCDGARRCTAFSASLTEVAAANPTVVVVSGGAGVGDVDEKQLTTNVTDYYRALRTAVPDATIVAVGPWSAAAKPTPAELSLEAAVASAAKAVRALHVNLLSPSAVDPTMTTKGGGQLNDVGHQAVADRLVGTLDDGTN